MAVTIDGTAGITTPAIPSGGPIAGTTGTFSGAVQASGVASNLYPLVSGTLVNTTSGTSFDFTGIPSWVKRITVMFGGVSTNGSSPVIVQIGDSGGIETTGYGSGAYSYNSGTSVNPTNGYAIDEGFGGTAQSRNGTYILTLLGDNAWSGFGITSNPGVTSSAGSKTLTGGPLDRLRITTVNGTDAFDSGVLNIMYEG
jgi:hypothetical protein